MPEGGKIRFNFVKVAKIKRISAASKKATLSEHILKEFKAKGIDGDELKHLAYKYSLPVGNDPAVTAWEHLFRHSGSFIDVRAKLTKKGFIDPFSGSEKFNKIYEWVNMKVAGRTTDMQKISAIVSIFAEEPEFYDNVISPLISDKLDPLYKYLSISFLFHLFAASQGLNSGIVFQKYNEVEVSNVYNWVDVNEKKCKVDLFNTNEISMILGGNPLLRQISPENRAIFGLPQSSLDHRISTLKEKVATGSQIFAAWQVAEGNKLQKEGKLFEAEERYKLALDIDNTDTFNSLTILGILGSKILENSFSVDAINVIKKRMLHELTHKENLKFNECMRYLSVRLAFRTVTTSLLKSYDEHTSEKQ